MMFRVFIYSPEQFEEKVRRLVDAQDKESLSLLAKEINERLVMVDMGLASLSKIQV